MRSLLFFVCVRLVSQLTRMVLNGRAPLHPQADVYSFAIIMNEMFSGERPFEDAKTTNGMHVMFLVGMQNLRPTLDADKVPPKVCPVYCGPCQGWMACIDGRNPFSAL